LISAIDGANAAEEILGRSVRLPLDMHEWAIAAGIASTAPRDHALMRM